MRLSNDGQKMDRRTLASRSQEVDRRHKRVSKPAGRFSRYNTAPEVDQELYRAIWKALSSITESLVGEERVYGSDLNWAPHSRQSAIFLAAANPIGLAEEATR